MADAAVFIDEQLFEKRLIEESPDGLVSSDICRVAVLRQLQCAVHVLLDLVELY